eukprot:1537752-Lingulodinium_polyedra.AAC.1
MAAGSAVGSSGPRRGVLFWTPRQMESSGLRSGFPSGLPSGVHSGPCCTQVERARSCCARPNNE